MTRIAVLGDWQYAIGEGDTLTPYLENINTLRPDVTVVIGDYGDHNEFGTPAGIYAAARHFQALDCPTVIPILGNHDLQYEHRASRFPFGTMENALTDAFGLAAKNTVYDGDGFRLLCYGLDPQTADDYATMNECFMNAGTLADLEEKLCEKPGVPVLLFTHAQPLGAGLHTVPDVHVRASNAFLNQGHHPETLLRLAEKYPMLRMWFCGHYHIGEHYPDSHTCLYGTHFFLTGVLSSVSRDGSRHSRVVDIENGNASVYTYDHNAKTLIPRISFPLVRPESEAVVPLRPANEPYFTDFTTASGRVRPGGLLCGENGRLYALTDNDRVWEIDPAYGEAMGTLLFEKDNAARAIFRTPAGVVVDTARGLRLHRYDEPHRFMPIKEENTCVYTPLAALPGDAVRPTLPAACETLHGAAVTGMARLPDGRTAYALDGDRPHIVIE